MTTQIELPFRIDLPGIDDHQPTRRLQAALSLIARWPQTGERTKADLTLYPVHQDQANGQAWYELWWTHRAVARLRDVEDGRDYLDITTVRIEQVAVLPAPPVIPVEKRLAAAGPVTLDGLSEGAIRLSGGPEEALRMLTRRRDAAISQDRTVDRFDWDACAATVLERLVAVQPRKLTAGQRGAVSLARYLDAIHAQDAARASASALLANAATAGDTGPLADLPQVLAILDPTLSIDPAIKDIATPAPDGPRANGRPRVGRPISVAFPEDMLDRIDAAARAADPDAAKPNRAAWLRQVAAAAVGDAERRSELA